MNESPIELNPNLFFTECDNQEKSSTLTESPEKEDFQRES